MIVPGQPSQSFAAALADALDAELAATDVREFPDGEICASVPGIEGGRAIVVCATTTPRAHLECLQLQDAVREGGATEVVTVLPYMGYARQDQAFEPGHPVSARAVARAISTGTDRVVTVNPHTRAVCDFFEVPCEPLDAAGRLAEPLPADLSDPVFLAPDENASAIATAVRDGYGAGDVDYFEKTRLSGSEVEISPSNVAVEGRDVVVADDIIATGSTMAEAVSILGERGAGRVFVACVHPMLAQDAYARLTRAGVERIVGTDTIERSVSAVSAAPVVAEALRE